MSRMRNETGLTERGASGVAQQPGQGIRLRHDVTESTGLEPRRTENAGVIAPPAGPGTAAQVDAPRSVSPDVKTDFKSLAKVLTSEE